MGTGGPEPPAWHLLSWLAVPKRDPSPTSRPWEPQNPQRYWGLAGSDDCSWSTTHRLSVAPCGLCALQSCPEVGEEVYDQLPAMKAIQLFFSISR